LQIGTRTFVSGNLSVTGSMFVSGGNIVANSGSVFFGDGSEIGRAHV
jgi:hypothetical protein